MELAFRKLERSGPLDAEEKRALRATFFRIREGEIGEDLARQGARPPGCTMLLKGMLARYETLPDGARQILAIVLPGDIYDLHGFTISVMDHSVGALTPATVAVAPYEAVSALARAYPRLSTLLLRESVVEAAQLRAWIANCGRRSAYARIAHLFCELYVRMAAVGLAAPYACDLPLTQATLGDATGLSVVHVNRVLQQLRGDGYISLKSGRLVIHDWEALAAAAGFDPTYLHDAEPIESGLGSSLVPYAQAVAQ